MKKIKIHNPTNEYTKNRFYNHFWDEFTNHLKENFEVEENRYFEQAHSGYMPVKLEKGISDGLKLMECEYIIENLETGEFVIMSISDNIDVSGIMNEMANPFLKKVLIAQYLTPDVNKYFSRYISKYYPWTYFQSDLFDLEPYYEKRQLNPPTQNKLYFKGTSLEDRTILNHIDKNIITPFQPIGRDKYFNEIIDHKIALSVDGRGEFCYRDIECFAIGVPILRFEYVSKMYDPLIPNYHYISIPRPKDMKLYRLGNEEHARILEKRYYNVLNDVPFLNFVSTNARKYYLRNCTMDAIISNTYNLLGLNRW